MPGKYPNETFPGRTGRAYYDEAMMGRVAEKIERYEWARKQMARTMCSCEWVLEMADQDLWDFVPPPEQIRAINVCIAHDCPTCGDEITRKAGHYPWIMSRERPFKVECPVCEGVFPSNEFEPWNLGGLNGAPERGPGYVDKGLGWLDADGRRYYFVAYYIFWQHWVRDVLGAMTNLSKSYLLSGRPEYAHKCAVMLAKIASEYDRFDYENQAYHEGISGVRGRISDYIWSNGNNSMIALAHDAIAPGLGEDHELLGFLQVKGIDDPQELIERNMLHVMVRDTMSGFVRGNMGTHQKSLCDLAIVLDNDDPKRGPTTEEMREWLMQGPGLVEDLLWNGFWREGLGGESSPSYSSGWCSSFYALAELLPRIGADLWSNPRLKKMADIGLDMTVAGQFCPSIGDCGSALGSSPVACTAALQGRAFSRYGDARHAKALARMGSAPEDLWTDYYEEGAVAETVQDEGTELGLKTRNLGGYGLAVLESGEGDHRRAVTMYYGDASGGHGHYDRLNIEMFAHGRPMLPEDGYPTPFTRPDFHEWRRADTVKHYCVMIDEQPQLNLHRGQLNCLAATPGVQVMDASAEAVYEGNASLYRRTAALIDFSAESSYLLDIFRVRGGAQHDYCFHGPPFPEFSVSGGQLGPIQEKGTLAGEDVPYGTWPPDRGSPSSGYQGLFKVHRMSPPGQWSATWRKPDEDLSLTMTMPSGCAQQAIAAEGEPELVPGSPETIQYVLARNRLAASGAEAEEMLSSRFISVSEPHRGPASISGVEHLLGDGSSLNAIGLSVSRGPERDLIHSSLASGETCEWQCDGGPLSVAAEFALLTIDEHGVKRVCVVNGTHLTYGDFALSPRPTPAGSVAQVDFERNAITIDSRLSEPEAYRDSVVILGSDCHQTSYTIKEAEAEGAGTRLGFGDVLFIVGMGKVAAINERTKTITSDRDLTGHGRTDGGRHAGRWLYNEDRSQGYRIAAVEGRTFILEGVDRDLRKHFSEANGEGQTLYWISDIGPGDTFRIPTSTYYAR